ncbi:hypothetical protein C4559_02455 [Candidatus Microgenomates bacterium]|nr:MAG: hypothetical protein C4559_02455 [Candidatus Microgenomates bacterium]
MIEVFFDVETKKLFSEIDGKDPALLGVSIMSVLKREIKNGVEVNSLMQSFWEKELMEAFKIFEEADRIIGFNSLKFDVLALKPYLPQKLSQMNHLDIMDKVKSVLGRRISLDCIAKETLGRTKTDDGLNAVLYWNRGDEESLSKLKSYCEADVFLTKDVYDFGMKNKHLKYMDPWNNSRKVEIDFSYPPAELSAKQVGLF